VKPSPVQARLLWYFAEHPDLCMCLWFSSTEWMPAETGHKGEIHRRSFGPNERFLRATISSCARVGWLQRIEGPADNRSPYFDPEHTSYLALAEAGKQALAHLQPSDFENKPQPSVAGEAGRILRALGAKHERPEWVFLTEAPVLSDNGPVHVDALAINCFWSKDFVTVGYEVKVSRSDFLGELKKPEKTAASARICSSFYFAVPKGMVKPEEIPAPYGLVNVSERGYARIAKRSVLERPAPTWGQLAFLLRRIVDEETTIMAVKEAA